VVLTAHSLDELVALGTLTCPRPVSWRRRGERTEHHHGQGHAGGQDDTPQPLGRCHSPLRAGGELWRGLRVADCAAWLGSHADPQAKLGGNRRGATAATGQRRPTDAANADHRLMDGSNRSAPERDRPRATTPRC